MSKINFYLKGIPNDEILEKLKKNDRKFFENEMNLPRAVILSVAHRGMREIYTTGKFIPLRFWNKKERVVKDLLETPKSIAESGKWLKEKKYELEKFLANAKLKYQTVSKGELYELIKGEVKKSKDVDTLEEILSRFTLEHKTKKGTSIKSNTVKKYKSLMLHIERFQGNNQFTPSQYSNNWVESFIIYLRNIAKINDNTLCKYITALKTFFTHFKKRGKIIPADFNEIYVSETEQIVNILTKKELTILENFHFESKYEDQIRDVFLYQCYTGSRYSDIEKINKNEIHTARPIWEYIDKKNGGMIKAPINKACQRIISKYLYLPSVLPIYKNQVMNRKLKTIAEIAGLNRMVKKISSFDGNKKEEYFPLYKIISTHMARKTFISLSLQEEMPERMVREVSGHKDERSFRRYINLNDTHIDKIIKCWDAMNDDANNLIG